MSDSSSPFNEAEDFAMRSALALQELEQRARAAVTGSHEHAARFEADLTAQLEAISATLAGERVTETQNAADIDQLQSEIEQLAANYEAAQAEWSAERIAFEQSRDDLLAETARLEADNRNARDEWARQLTDFEHKLREQQADWNAQRTEWAATRAVLEAECEGLQQKFELALEDVHRYRGRVSELEQDLARRPEVTQTDSAELVALRAERDALIERVEQLEKQPATHIDPNTEQQLSDLQRRFELAVEDVRDLKTKNAKLESQLAAGEAALAAGVPRAPRPTDPGAMDWESQKRRLLASLEDESETPDEPARQEERIRIAATIEMTDAIVAEKDREISELRSQLASSSASATPRDELHTQKINELVDADEVIAEHRQRIAQLEREMEATLRAAELELSLERAKIARERVELDELRAALDSYRQEIAPNGMPVPGAPRRRWLSKLGLSGDE